jgi:hypothetical protein
MYTSEDIWIENSQRTWGICLRHTHAHFCDHIPPTRAEACFFAMGGWRGGGEETVASQRKPTRSLGWTGDESRRCVCVCVRECVNVSVSVNISVNVCVCLKQTCRCLHVFCELSAPQEIKKGINIDLLAKRAPMLASLVSLDPRGAVFKQLDRCACNSIRQCRRQQRHVLWSEQTKTATSIRQLANTCSNHSTISSSSSMCQQQEGT